MIDVKKLPDDVQELKKVITQLQENYEKKINALLEDIELWKKRLYGPKSEKYYANNDEQQFLFNEAEMGYDESQTYRQQPHVEVKAHTRMKRGRKKLPESLERIVKEIDIPESQKMCPSGKMRKFIKWESSVILDNIESG